MAMTKISDLCANLTLANVDDDDGSMQIPDVPVDHAVGDGGYYVVCRVVTNKQIRFQFFQDTISLVWQLAMGLTMWQLQPQRLQPGEDPENVVLQFAEFWVQIHSLPIGFRSEIVVSAIESFLGNLVYVDDRNFDGGMRMFYRIRVAIDVSKPLKKQMKLKKGYGHGDRVCPRIIHGVDRQAEKPFGVWLRARTRRVAPMSGQRWVAPESYADCQNWRSPAMVADATMRQAEDKEKGKESMQLYVFNPVLVPISGSSVDGVPVIIVGEQKRKRTDFESDVLNDSCKAMDCESVVSKNGLEAGTMASDLEVVHTAKGGGIYLSSIRGVSSGGGYMVSDGAAGADAYSRADTNAFTYTNVCIFATDSLQFRADTNAFSITGLVSMTSVHDSNCYLLADDAVLSSFNPQSWRRLRRRLRDIIEATKWCCVVVTNWKEGCTVYRKDRIESCRLHLSRRLKSIPPVPEIVLLVDLGLYVTKAALLGNLFGSLIVGQIEFSKFDSVAVTEGSYATIYQLWDGGDVKQVWWRNRNSALLLGLAWKLGPLSGVVKVEDD
nr:uncharacterized protein LOC109174453 [Ipomoea batatas]